VTPQVVPVVMADHAPGLAAALVAWTSMSIAVAPARPVSVYGLVTPDNVVQVPAPVGLERRLYPVAAPWVLSIAGAAQVTVSLLFVPSGGGATLAIAGAFGAYGPAVAVVSVLVADHALVPPAFELWSWTSIAAPAARPDRVYGLVTPDTVVQVPAPEGLDRRLNPVAALCVLSIAGAVQVTVRLLPVPCASDAGPGVFGAAVAVVSVLVADHALVPPAFEPWIWTSIATPAARPDRVYGLVTPETVVQVPAPEGLDCRLNPVAALCVLSIAGAVQVTVRSLPGPCASDAVLGVFGAAAAVASVLVADHALVPAAFELWSWTSIAAPAARPDRVYGLVTPDTVVQVAAPEGLDRRLNPMAAPCVLSIAGAVHVTVRALPGPCTSDTALGGFAICSVGVGVGVGELGSLKACMTAVPRFATRGVGRYIGIFGAVPVSVTCMW